MNPQLNKKVKKYLDSYFRDTKANSPEHQEAVMLILKGALTDANFHSEAKELGKYFPKASKKYIGTPMEDVIESKGTEISKMANWDGHDIIDAFAFYLSMSIGGSFGNRLMSLKESIQVNEKNEPNNKELWSRAIAAAKAKYDVYPSAYANAFASNWYKEKGGTWKTKSESVVNEVKYDTAIADFNKELEKNSEVKKAAKHYKKSTKDVVKALQSKIKVNRYSDKSIKQISIDYKEDGPFSSKVSIKLSKDYKQNESVNEVASRTAMEIGGLTGVNKDAIQKFVDDNKLDIEKVYQFVKKGKLADRMKLVSAIAGKPNNPVQKKMVKQFGESVNESVEGMSKEQLDSVARGMFGKSYSRLTMDQTAKLKFYLRKSKKESVIKEAAKLKLGKDSVSFKVMGDKGGLTILPATGNDLDKVQDAIAADIDVKEELRRSLEKQLKIPVETERGYEGGGFRFIIDFYSLAKQVK